MLQTKLKHLPNQAGVYQYFDINGRLLYIGKAKNLKNRVKSYFQKNLTSPRIAKMVSEIHDLEYIVLESENDAFILENSLIKQLKPKYNILLRDDKTYPYIYIDMQKEFPRFEITRKIIDKKNISYFGPFVNGARELLSSLYLIFPMVQKSGCERSKKACLFHQIGRCLAPCEKKIDQASYKKMVQNATSIIHNPKLLIKSLEEKMNFYAQNLNFEEAAQIRDKIKSISSMQKFSHLDSAKLESFDLFAIEMSGDIACLVRFFIRDGKVVSSTHNITKSLHGFDLDELYRQLIIDSYPKEAPVTTREIFVAYNLAEKEELSHLLSNIHGKKITIKHPQIGDKKALCDIALKNAVELINQQNRAHKISLELPLKEFFGFENLPLHVEVFDNSHLGGQNAVGAMIVSKNGKLDKSSYRHFHLNYADEYSQMSELLTNRALRFDKQSAPDLWVIDGGMTLLNLAKDIIKSSGVHVDIIAISKEKVEARSKRAKGSAKDILHFGDTSLKLSTLDPKLQFFQNLRDEAHRFAITFHRKTKQKNDKNSSKLRQLGVGEGSIKKLLDYFGSFEKIHAATNEEIASVVGKRVANKLLEPI